MGEFENNMGEFEKNMRKFEKNGYSLVPFLTELKWSKLAIFILLSDTSFILY